MLACILNTCCFISESLSSLLTCILSINLPKTQKPPFLLSYHYGCNFLFSLQRFLHQSIFPYYHHCWHSCLILPIHHCIPVMLSQGQSFYPSFSDLYVISKRFSRLLTRDSHFCLIQFSAKKASYFQQKSYYVNSYTQTRSLSAEKHKNTQTF